MISADPDEIKDAAALVNTNGDWGYVTLLINKDDQKLDKWQAVFNNLRDKHLIPIVRIATKASGNSWEVPSPEDGDNWANFLDSLNWPVKNRYVLIYNEPNQGKEWGGSTDPAGYAKVLNQTIDSLKHKSSDFFILNAGFDASAPQQAPSYFDEEKFLTEMNQTVPGIFNKLDGWSSHSYPNPGFVGSPDGTGRGSVKTWVWELETLRKLGLNKNLPVFITETGWKHAEGINYDKNLPSSDQVGSYYKQAFASAWSSSQIVAVTPFLLDYQAIPFDHFSFKKLTGETQNPRILGVSIPSYYTPYQVIASMGKTSGHPVQENKAKLVKGEIYKDLVAGQSYNISLTFKNVGESTWNEQDPLKLNVLEGGQPLKVMVQPGANEKVIPGNDYTFNLSLKAPDTGGSFNIALNLSNGQKDFSNVPFRFTTEIKAPVELQVKDSLQWKKDSAGEYLLSVAGAIGNTIQRVMVGSDGNSEDVEANYLLPEYTFDFTLQKPFYKPKTITQAVHSGKNTLDFGTLEPDIPSAILNPSALWNLLPFSN